MESLIIIIIIGIISSVFSKKGNPKETKQMPPFSQQPVPKQEPRQATTAAPKSLEDFANEIFGRLEQKQPEVVREVLKPKPVEVQQPETRKQVVAEPVKRQERSQKRENIEQTARVKQIQEKTKPVFVTPTTQQALMQAVITSEILGPPKAKQRPNR
ncbi:hypothetical protein [Solibacillus sp. CAU 1738]|uniref:hypothetical protein n=1 Tax=Solibacillus sp. CAU 1738 TaxID=3140363 RepID=UPI0032617FE1